MAIKYAATVHPFNGSDRVVARAVGTFRKAVRLVEADVDASRQTDRAVRSATVTRLEGRERTEYAARDFGGHWWQRDIHTGRLVELEEEDLR